MAGSGFDLMFMINNVRDVAVAAQPTIAAMGYVLGLYFMMTAAEAMLNPERSGAGDRVDKRKVGGNVLFGSIFLQIGRMIAEVGALANDGGQTRQALAYIVPESSGGFYGTVLQVVFLWVALIGAFGVFRGFLLWRDNLIGSNQSGGNDLFWRGLWHIVGGGIAMNL